MCPTSRTGKFLVLLKPIINAAKDKLDINLKS